MRTHLHAYARCIYIHEFRTGIGLRVYLPSCPSWMPHAFPVRQASVLHAASFGFRLATDTLAVQLTVPPVGPVEDFHLRVGAPCRAHKRKRAPRDGEPFVSSCQRSCYWTGFVASIFCCSRNRSTWMFPSLLSSAIRRASVRCCRMPQIASSLISRCVWMIALS